MLCWHVSNVPACYTLALTYPRAPRGHMHVGRSQALQGANDRLASVRPALAPGRGPVPVLDGRRRCPRSTGTGALDRKAVQLPPAARRRNREFEHCSIRSTSVCKPCGPRRWIGRPTSGRSTIRASGGRSCSSRGWGLARRASFTFPLRWIGSSCFGIAICRPSASVTIW